MKNMRTQVWVRDEIVTLPAEYQGLWSCFFCDELFTGNLPERQLLWLITLVTVRNSLLAEHDSIVY